MVKGNHKMNWMIILIILCFILLCTAICSPSPLPPELGFVESAIVILYEPENAEANEKGWLEYEINDSERLGLLVHALTQNTSTDTGDCGFGDLRLILEGNGQSLMFLPALDDCPTIFVVPGSNDPYGDVTLYNENQYSISPEGKEWLNYLLTECFPSASENWAWNT